MKRKAGRTLGSAWWAQQWLECLEDFGWEDALTKGRAYVRRGMVQQMEFFQGKVEAWVLGSRSAKHHVKIEVQPFREEDWQRILNILVSQAVFMAKLLTGEMPDTIDHAFKEEKIALYPRSREELNISCSCGEEEMPCRHIAAVCHMMAEEFSQDPFLLLKLRGRDREEIIEELRYRRTIAAQEKPCKERKTETETDEPYVPGDSMERYWVGWFADLDMRIVIEPPPVKESILKRLGEPPFLSGKKDMIRQLEMDYQKVLLKAMTVGYEE